MEPRVFTTASSCLLVALCCMAGMSQTMPGEDEQAFYESRGYTLLAGPIQGTLSQGAYLIHAPVTIRPHETVTIEPGSLLLFSHNTSLKISGRLDVRGGPRGTVTFGVMPSDKYRIPLAAGAVNRWQGIQVSGNAAVDLRYAIISGAHCAIELQSDTAEVLCDHVNFQNNETNIRVNGFVVPAAENRFHSLTLSGADKVATWSSVEAARNKAISDSTTTRSALQRADHSRQRPLRLVCGMTGGICAAIALGGVATNAVFYEKYTSATPATATSGDMTRWKRNARTGTAAAVAGGIAAVLSMTGFSLTFIF